MDMMERREATPAMEDLFARQRARYLSGATRPVRARLDALAKLHEVLKRHEEELLRALAEDLGKSPEEAYMTEMGVVYDELRFARRRLRAWSLPRFALPSVGQFPGYGLVRRDPYGLVLILSPWNYPLQLCLAPLIAAVAAGNCAPVLAGAPDGPGAGGRGVRGLCARPCVRRAGRRRAGGDARPPAV